jgi:hypothetical protein
MNAETLEKYDLHNFEDKGKRGVNVESQDLTPNGA